MGLLYFFPGPSLPAEHGLPFAEVQVCRVNTGPDPAHASGGVVAGHTGTARVGYYPDTQVWACKAGRWIGRAGAIRPEQLQRETFLDGHPVRLADGQVWTVAPARVYPLVFDLDESGGLTGRHAGRFVELGRHAERVWDLFVAASEGQDLPAPPGRQAGGRQEVSLTTREGLDIAAAALGVNYRVGLPEVLFLGLVDSENLRSVLEAMIDLPALMAAHKKKEAAAGSAMSDGPGGSPPDINPPL